jgi:hypothetical protein
MATTLRDPPGHRLLGPIDEDAARTRRKDGGQRGNEHRQSGILVPSAFYV